MSPASAHKKDRVFDPDTFLATIGEGRKIVAVPKKQTIYTQGDEADAVFYIQKGKVRLTVVSKTGMEATIAIVSEKKFFGESSLAVRFFVWDPQPQCRPVRLCGLKRRR